MVANLSAHKRGWDDRWEEYSNWAVKAQAYKEKLLFFVDEDTRSFNKVMDSFRLPKGTDEEKVTRSEAISKATKYAIDTPLAVMQTAHDSMQVMLEMSKIGLEASISDAGVGAMCALTAIRGAGLNVKINCSGFKDTAFVEDRLSKAALIIEKATTLEKEIVSIAESKL